MNRTKRNALKGRFASIFEKVIWDDAKERGIEITYEPESFQYEKRPPRGAKCGDCGSSKVSVPGSYTPDFKVQGRFFVEAKGYLNAPKRTLMEAFRKSNPELDLRFLFAQDNWLTHKKKTKYTDWAKQIGVKSAVGNKIPEEWLGGTRDLAKVDRELDRGEGSVNVHRCHDQRNKTSRKKSTSRKRKISA